MHSLMVEGKVGRVSELKKVGDTSVLNFTLASGEYGGKQGNKTAWFSCSVWGDYAESVAQYIEKGKGIAAVGRLEFDENGNPRTYQTQDNESRANFSLRVERLSFTSNVAQADTPKATNVSSDDIPF